MNNKWFGLLCVLGFSLLTGCINPYTKFYQSYTGGKPAASLDNYEPCDEPIQIFSSASLPRDIDELFRNSYVPIGRSSFNGAEKSVSTENAIAQAKSIGACRVLFVSKHSGSVSGVMPLTVPNNSTSYTSANANAYGSGGYANVRGNSTTTTYGQQTLLMPYTVERYDAEAVYFIKARPKLGAKFLPTPPELSKEIGQNGGLLISVIVRGGPAAQADLFEGDVLMELDGKRLVTSNNMELIHSITDEKYGKAIQAKIWRNGQAMTKSITLGQ